MKSTKWKAVQIIQLIFVLVSIFIFIRSIDGHGAVQTTAAKMISFIVWLIFYLFVIAVEWIAYFIIKRSKK